MVAILTLFVGLVAGMQEVQVAVSEPVVRVELRLNDRLVGRISGPPWVGRCDFGSGLHPAKLSAVGFDAEGREVISDVRWVNLPDRRAEAVIVPEFDDDKRVIGARVKWSSPELHDPRKVRAVLDGEEIPVAKGGRIDLSGASLDEVHVLSVAVEFTREVVLRKELVFGKGHAGEVESGLTAVPIELQEGHEIADAGALEGLFVVAGQPVPVMALEEGGGQLVVVRDHALEPMLEGLLKDRKAHRRRVSERWRDGIPDSLGDSVSLRVMAPVTVQMEADARRTMLFPISPDASTDRKGLLKVVTAARYPRRAFGLRRLADAVALAGMRAATGNRRRAVLLLLGPSETDASMHDARTVRAYLGDLRVPFRVWNLAGDRRATAAAWGTAPRLESFDDFLEATRSLAADLEKQRIVWLRGRYLPQEIRLSPEAEGFTLAR